MLNSNILIIDDDPGVRKTLADILRIKGYGTMVATNGAEALAQLKTSAVNVVLIDLGLPDMNGIELLNRVKADHPKSEAIILTGNATLDSAIEATNRGAFSYLLKPCDIEQLVLNIRRAIEKQQGEEEIRRQSLELQKVNADLQVLYALSQAITRTIDIDTLLFDILQTLTELLIFRFDRKGMIFLLDEERLRLVAHYGLSAAELEPCKSLRVGECLCGMAAADGEIVVSKNHLADCRHVLRNSAMSPHGHVIIPLKTAKKIAGVLCLYLPSDKDVSKEVCGLLATMGGQIGIAVENARLYSEAMVSSLHDPLTGLANRRFMDIQMEKLIDSAKRYNRALSVIMLDIDHFKNYNDTHGHLEGDRLLVKVAQTLLNEVRNADFLFRYGGEEFLVVLPETGLPMAFDVAERLRLKVAAEAGVTISLGVNSCTGPENDRESLVRRADEALYRAKEGGRNRVELTIQPSSIK